MTWAQPSSRPTMTSDPNRFHLTLTEAERPVMHGWWGNEVTARGKFATWVGSWGKPGVGIILVDEASKAVLKSWPEGT